MPTQTTVQNQNAIFSFDGYKIEIGTTIGALTNIGACDGDISAAISYTRDKVESANAGVLFNNIKQMETDYKGTKRKDWDRTNKEQINQWRLELAGIKASYNGLCAEYNAQMSIFNWKFTNAGLL